MAGMFDGKGQHDEAAIGALPFSVQRDPSPVSFTPEDLTSEVLWTGHCYGLSGYAKANREIVLRLAHTMVVSFIPDPSPELGDTDQYSRARTAVHPRVIVSEQAPFVRFYTPVAEKPAKAQSPRRHRVVYTMMETARVHPGFVEAMNANYDEAWTPTGWNRDAFVEAGLSIPCRVMPLGADPAIYRPRPATPLPSAQLMTTPDAGLTEVPRGFVFLSVFQPTFRKGADALVRAFDDAFMDDPDVSLVLATTYNSVGTDVPLPNFGMRSRIYTLRGRFTERGMAGLYNGAQAYASASRGEGWNMPAVEAAMCGLPVVCPSHTAHAEFAGEGNAWLAEPEGFEPWPGAKDVCPWYEGMPFAKWGDTSNDQLVELLREVRAGGVQVRRRAARLSGLVRSRYTWGHSAQRVRSRLEEIQP